MTTKSTTGDFDFHVDPKHYGFQWKGPMCIFVQYSAIKDGDRVIASIDSVTAEPWLINSIVIHNNWMAVNTELIAAAQCAAEKEFNRNVHVDETILGALVPHIGTV